MSKPIIITNYPTVKEQIKDKVTGIICDYNNEYIALKIKELIKNKAMTEDLSKNCKFELNNQININEFISEL